jgi:hydroxymethylpyrimidine pyrophosphatase-like HAD family hydrolase
MKKCTIFCDIDGTLLKYRSFASYKSTIPETIDSTIKSINDAFNSGNCVILTTARPEYLRHHTLKELDAANIQYNRLIMGIERGDRILINDNEKNNVNRAHAINVNRNKGFSEEDNNLFNKLVN